MRVLYDYQAFQMQKYGGVSRSYIELCSELIKLGVDCKLGVKESDNVHLKNSGLVGNLKPNQYNRNRIFGQKQSFKGEYRIKEVLIKLMNYSIEPNVDYCKRLLKQQQFDIFEPTFFDSYFLSDLSEKPFVLTIHDMIPELFPQYFKRDDYQIVQKKR